MRIVLYDTTSNLFLDLHFQRVFLKMRQREKSQMMAAIAKICLKPTLFLLLMFSNVGAVSQECTTPLEMSNVMGTTNITSDIVVSVFTLVFLISI